MTVPLLALGGMVLLVAAWANVAIGIKRYHDRGKSGWWVLVQPVPVFGTAWHLVEAGMLPGGEGSNGYGEAPGAKPCPATCNPY